jgi:hypothetical protein
MGKVYHLGQRFHGRGVTTLGKCDREVHGLLLLLLVILVVVTLAFVLTTVLVVLVMVLAVAVVGFAFCKLRQATSGRKMLALPFCFRSW